MKLKKQLKSLFGNFAYYENQNNTILLNALNKLNNNFNITLLDIGAAGDIEPRWNKIQHVLHYIGFEPDDRSRTILLNKKTNCLSYQIIDKAVWDTKGSIDINLCAKPQVSSYFSPKRAFLDLFPESNRFDIESIENLQTNRLDDLDVSNVDFIKIDIQGGELKALIGGEQLLSKTLGLEIEVEFLELYKGQPLFGDITAFLSKHQIEFLDFVSLHRWERDVHKGFGQCIFGDALFLRSPENMLQIAKGDMDLIAKYLGICLLYYRFDLIDTVLKKFSKDNNNQFLDFHKSIQSLKKKQLRVHKLVIFFTRVMRIFGKEYRPHVLY